MNNFQLLASKLKGKKILITGASGFVGKNICETLIALNSQYDLKMEITGFARKPFALPGLNFFSQDVLQPIALDKPFDYIIHAATPVTKAGDSDQKTLDIIVKGTENVLEFAKKSSPSHFLLVSSGAVYGELSGPVSEDHKATTALKSAYAEGKALSESLCGEFIKKNQIILNVARCFAFSGRHLPLEAHFAIGNFVKDALCQRDIHIQGDGSAIRSYMDAEDMVYWLLTILLHDKNDVFNVGSDQAISIRDLAKKVSEFTPGLKVIIHGQTNSEIKKNIYVPSLLKSENILGLKLETSLEVSIKKMMDFNRV